MTEKNQLYRKKIVKHLYFSNTLSCADLSDKINKSLPVTTKMLGKLIEEGWVTEIGFAASTGGRRAVMYSLKPDVLYVVSVAMDQLITRIAILNMQNTQVTATANRASQRIISPALALECRVLLMLCRG
jgi:hypothetical protein